MQSLLFEGAIVPPGNKFTCEALCVLFLWVTGKQSFYFIYLETMEDLTKSWSCLTLSENEGSGLRLTEEQAELEHILAVKFLTKRALNIDAIAKTFTPLWRAKNGFKIQKEGDHVVLFTFDDKSELEKIVAAEPWSFDKHIMVLQNYDKKVDLTEMEFKWVTFWAQVYDIPIRFRNKRVAERICEAIGKVNVRFDDNESKGDAFIRIRVTIDISKPLCRGRVISLDSVKELWVPFKYERLPNMCYWCGCLTHDDRDCEQWVESEGSLSNESKQFGPWIHAPPFFPSRKNIIKVPDFYTRWGQEPSTTPPPAMGKLPMFVVRTGKPVPEIIRAEKEGTANGQQDINDTNSQENIMRDSRQNSDNSGISRNLKLKVTDLKENRSADEIFEERIVEIDKELKRFDPTTIPAAKNIVDMVQKIERGATWKRLNKTETGTDVVMEDIVGEKMRGDGKDDQSELLKKRKVSQAGKKNKLILAEAGSQPCHNQ